MTIKKIFEKLTHYRIMQLIENQDFPSSAQFDFRKNFAFSLILRKNF